MKRILITGANSYIGTSFEKYLAQWPEDYHVDTISVRGEAWKQYDFSGYDSVLHVAGIAHIRETEDNKHLYFEVNRDLAVAVAEKAKNCGVPQFVFMSSLSVYGLNEGVITRETVPRPKSNYGKSKFQAEALIGAMNAPDFVVAILRPPMVYGDNCKGNYQTLVKLAKSLPVFPNIRNQRSMVQIKTLVAFLKNTIDSCASGIFVPQEPEFICTSDLVREIAQSMDHTLFLTRILNPMVYLAKLCSSRCRKAFGSLIYQEKR